MARMRDNARRYRRRVLVLSLLVQNPTEITDAPAPAGVTTRARSRRLAAATTALPEEILVWEIFVRLPANHILRCRTVCRYWHRLTSAPDFLLAHHRHQPWLLLRTRYATNPVFQHGHPILGFDDYSGFKIHASCDGLLILSLSDNSFSICNPATRQCAPLPGLTAAGRDINTAALYQHPPSGEYRVLYWRWGSHQEEAAYCILTVRRGHSRSIGVPSDTPGIDKAKLAWNEGTTTDSASPAAIVLHNCLHWGPRCLLSKAGILVFDTVVETFRLMRGPADATTSTTLRTGLCDMAGSIGFGYFGDRMTFAKIWVLEDYETELWSFKYHVELSERNLCCYPEDTQRLVLSHKGDVLVYNHYYGYMYHCDNTGKLLGLWSMDLIGPWFKESLVKHDFFPRQGCARAEQQRFFERL